MKFLITGAKGQLAREFLRVLQRAKGEEQIVKKKSEEQRARSLCVLNSLPWIKEAWMFLIRRLSRRRFHTLNPMSLLTVLRIILLIKQKEILTPPSE